MKKETDSRIARKYIKENKDNMERTAIVNHLFQVTNLSKTTIRNIFTQIEKIREYAEEKLSGKDGQNAKKFIENNIDIMTEEEIIEYLVKNTRLNELSAEAIYHSVTVQEIKESKKEDKEELLYKGRKRSFFMIDDSKLWRNSYES